MDRKDLDNPYAYIFSICQKANISFEDYYNPVKRLDSLYIAYQNGNASWDDYSNNVKKELEDIEKHEKSSNAQIDVWSLATCSSPEANQSAKETCAKHTRSMLDAIHEHIRRIELDNPYAYIFSICQKANISFEDYYNPAKRLDSLYIAYQRGNASWDDYSNNVKKELENIEKYEKRMYDKLEEPFYKKYPEKKQKHKNLIDDEVRYMQDSIREHIGRVE